MTGVATLLRALRHRVGISVVILLVALCATAAATVGPTYYVAARHSILQDSLISTSVLGRGYQATQQGPVQNAVLDLRDRAQRVLDAQLGAKRTNRLFQPPVEALETSIFFRDLVLTVPLVWRDGVCAHVHFRSGSCPTARNDVAVATSLAGAYSWKVGTTIRPTAAPALHVVGIYVPPDASGDYWFGRGGTYFAAELPTDAAAPYDAMFTPQSTIDGLHHNPQGRVLVSQLLNVPRVTPSDVDALEGLDERFGAAPGMQGASVATGFGSLGDSVHASWSALAVPVVVVTAELLVLTWLLLFLVVTDAVEARGTEIALSKLRGYGAARSLVFGLGEPLALLGAALPAGALLGWALTRVLSGVLLRTGTPVPLPGLGWAAAAIAAVGGLAAVVVAARRTLTRPVVEQWRRTARRSTDRGWLFDAIVLTGAVAGLVQLVVGGTIGSAKHSALALLVPGLLGLAAAVVGSRLLPVACRALFGRTRHSGGLGAFLAARHIARRPGGTRTTMILATAVALATFSIAAWSVAAGNRTRVAQVTVGAPTVLTVAPEPGTDLGAVVDRIDPGGRTASAVVSFDSGTTVVLGVQPDRFARVAHWKAAGVDDPRALLSGLQPPAPGPLVLDGQRVRVDISTGDLDPPEAELIVDVVATGGSSPTPVDLGVLARPHTRYTRSADLAGCPCTVRDVQVSPVGGQQVQQVGDVTLHSLEVNDGGTWRRLDGVTQSARWTDTQDQQVSITSSADGLHWSFFAEKSSAPTLTTHDRPEPMPAVVSAAAAGGDATVDAAGLDAQGVRFSVLARPQTLPFAPSTGILTDLTYASRAAFGNIEPSTAQVWVRGDPAPIRAGLARAHVPVIRVQTSAALDDQLSRQGPGLASVLFLADAAAAAVLAALAAILSLSAAARRRRYEYAALAATGATPRTLFTALALEQVVVVGFGALLGVGAGLVATAIAGKSVPEFVTAPADALVHDQPSPLLLALVLGGGFVLLLTAALLAAGALLRSVTPDQLREAPS